MNDKLLSSKSTDHLLYQSESSLGLLNAKSIKISQNNKIAILSSNGICLMRSDNDWNESISYRQYFKYVIPNPKENYAQNLHKIIKSNLINFTLDQMQKIYLDHTLLPMNNSTLYKAYRSFEWSFGLCFNSDNPLFALLSMEHELWIFKIRSK